MNTTDPDVIEQICRHFDQRGTAMYVGEPVTQTEHALQCAAAAEKSGASAALVTASLLHDVGHLLHALGEDCADNGIDDQHERLVVERKALPREDAMKRTTVPSDSLPVHIICRHAAHTSFAITSAWSDSATTVR